MNNDMTFEEYINDLMDRGFALSSEYNPGDYRLWIRVRKGDAASIGYIDPRDHLTFKIVVWNMIKDLVNNVEKLLEQEGEKV